MMHLNFVIGIQTQCGDLQHKHTWTSGSNLPKIESKPVMTMYNTNEVEYDEGISFRSNRMGGSDCPVI